MPEPTLPMSELRYSAPSPEVQHLPTLFRRIQAGEIRIPAFQRDFVWKEKQVLEILESVYNGYPIGSLLFWRVDEPILAVEHVTRTSFPNVPEHYPLSFVLDGLQRLSTLYGVFHQDRPDIFGMLNVTFDLREQRFMHMSDAIDLSACINLAHIFAPRDFIAAQRQLSEQTDGELLLERTILLHSTFQEYMVPTVTLSKRSLADVVQIFERVNSTGLKLDSVDFMRAVTWSEEFDLTRELAALAAHLESDGFEVPTEALMKVVSVIAGKMPTPASMLELRSVPAAELKTHVARAREAITATIAFLNESCRVFSYDFVPYEGQLLVLARFFNGVSAGGTNEARAQLKRWFWGVSFNEELRGKPDHYVVRLLRRLDALIAGEVDVMRLRLSVSPADFIERRMLAGAALSGAVAGLFAAHEARSCLTEAVIPPEAFMSAFDTNQFVPIFTLAEMRTALARDIFSPKIMANVIVSPELEDRAWRAKSGREKLIAVVERFGARSVEIFQSQLLPEAAVSAAIDGDIEKFLQIRAEALYSAARVIAD